MDNRDWLIKAYANNKIPKNVKIMWEPIMWCAANMDILPKIMGRVPCSEQERKGLEEFLMSEKRYELYISMIHSDYDDTRNISKIWDEKAEAEVFENDGVYQNHASGQLLSFMKWCDEKDLEEIFESTSAIDKYRLCYLSLVVGYNKLTLLLAMNMSNEEAREGAEILEKFGSKSGLLFKKWVSDFYRKQPDGKGKRKLAKRIVRYGTMLLRKADNEI